MQNYYGLLPGNTAAAWDRLGPTAQAQSGGRGGFDRFYAGMRSVTLENARPAGGNAVAATIVFVQNNGTTTREGYRFVVGGEMAGRSSSRSAAASGTAARTTRAARSRPAHAQAVCSPTSSRCPVTHRTTSRTNSTRFAVLCTSWPSSSNSRKPGDAPRSCSAATICSASTIGTLVS